MTARIPNDPHVLALHALATTLGDERRAHRLIDVTGLDIAELRARAADPVLLAACLTFLEAHEPDLIAVAGDLDVDPATLVAARHALEA